MMFKYNPRQWISHQMEVNRLHLARPDALLRLAGLGLLTGLLAGAVIVLFRLLVEQTQEAILPGTGAENYEALPLWARIALPVFGGLCVGYLMGGISIDYRFFSTVGTAFYTVAGILYGYTGKADLEEESLRAAESEGRVLDAQT